MPNMTKYAKHAYLGTPNMVKSGVPEKILQNAVLTRWSQVNRTLQSKVMTKSHFGPIAPLTSNWSTPYDHEDNQAGILDEHHLKGELKRFFYRLKVFICPKLRQVSKGNFHRKTPKWVKNQVKGTKIDQIRTKWHPTC